MMRFSALFSDIDLAQRFRSIMPPFATRIVVAIMCLAPIGLARFVLDIFAPGAAPFALIFPAVMMATLFAGSISGSITLTIAMVWAWYSIKNVERYIAANDTSQPAVFVVVAIAGLFTLVLADLFRQAVRLAQYDRDQQIADRDLFLREFDHRVKNNFAIVISLLELQRRRADPATAEALGAALARVEGIARAHQHLYRGTTGQPGTVEIAAYLDDLCKALSDALSLAHGIEIRCDSEQASVTRDRAVTIGLIVNELVTNAAKHAFPGREKGHIDIGCHVVPSGLRLTVADNGVGISAVEEQRNDRRGGLGTKLVDAFARQANGVVNVDSDQSGTRVTLDLAA